MTRKQALLQAIRILEKNNKNKQIVKVLKDIYLELPLTHWTEKNILDSFEQFILDYNRLPKKCDLCGKLPSIKAIERIFGISSLLKFEQKYFPEFYIGYTRESPYWFYTDQEIKECFIYNYNLINNGRYVKYNEYNLYKTPGTPSIQVIIKRMKCSSYSDLIEKTGITKRKHNLSVNSNMN